jgi:glycerol-3-phosphate dehydrogenase
VADERLWDLVVVGGGINGAGIARDAAGRGLSVLVVEKDDLASATSSASTKLIHGGLRYLEYYAFRLVRKSLMEREVLLRAAPHIIRPLRFVLPHMGGLRPAWFIRLGLFLYDHLGGREILPGCEGIDLRDHPAGEPLGGTLKKAFVYSDCWVDDARLVVLNAMDAAARGAEIATRTECTSARRDGGHWQVDLRDRASGAARTVRARALVNATGPWASSFLADKLAMPQANPLRLVKGSHIVVPRLFDHPFAYIFQNPDRRIVFAIPFEGDFTMIGTTEVDVSGRDPAAPAIDASETAYLCDAANGYFSHRIGPDDVVWSFSGVRPLYDDAAEGASAVTRDYMLEMDAPAGRPPLLNVLGGKLTTYRKLAEEALARLGPPLGLAAGPWTATAALPGGDIGGADFDGFLAAFRADYPFLPPALGERYARAYGTLAAGFLGSAKALGELGEDLGDGLYEAEVRHLVENEWARTTDDILWRRSKLGLYVSDASRARLETWFEGAAGADAGASAARSGA